ncbi:MAG TPA: helix-turn-helix domain-containing protein [Candidatus Saccharimonadales bacterium]|nr:helix-turn-helix domain-containing protein [Candidatus Saccharimonadales bacterium]
MFQVHRSTVIKIAQRHQLPQHRLKLTPDKVEHAAKLYRSGKSLSTIGVELGVHASTVHAALLKVDVPMRNQHGHNH